MRLVQQGILRLCLLISLLLTEVVNCSPAQNGMENGQICYALYFSRFRINVPVLEELQQINQSFLHDIFGVFLCEAITTF
jgi:hypothetical protein